MHSFQVTRNKIMHYTNHQHCISMSLPIQFLRLPNRKITKLPKILRKYHIRTLRALQWPCNHQRVLCVLKSHCETLLILTKIGSSKKMHIAFFERGWSTSFGQHRRRVGYKSNVYFCLQRISGWFNNAENAIQSKDDEQN